VPQLSASAVVIHYEEALYQVYAPLLLAVCTVGVGIYYVGASALDNNPNPNHIHNPNPKPTPVMTTDTPT